MIPLSAQPISLDSPFKFYALEVYEQGARGILLSCFSPTLLIFTKIILKIIAGRRSAEKV
jgi:hypothetical protein